MSESATSQPDVYDLIVIGAGPGGYVAAIRAAQLGLRVACIDRQFLGGTCLNIGCIPSKALLDSSYKFWEAKNKFSHHGIQIKEIGLDLKTLLGRKDQVVRQLTGGVGYLFKKHKIDSLIGSGRIVSPGAVEVKGADGTRTLKARRILIATGSAPVELPGIAYDGKTIVGSTEALSFDPIPQRLLVIGAGYIGLELGSVWARLGSKVHFLEFTQSVLPLMDVELSGLLHRILEKQGLTFQFNTSAQKAEVKDGKVNVTWKSGDKTGVETADRVLVATGRRPVTDGLGLKEIGVQLDPKGFVKIDPHFTTNVPGIWAIGDVVGGLMLAHKAEEEGIAAAEIMAGKAGHVNYHTIPGVVYTHPELAQVGLTEADAKREGKEVRIGKFPMSANGRAKSMDDTEGMVKIVGDAKTDRLLGVQILAAHASDMIAECAVAMELAASVEDLARTTHAHPTLPEAVKEAAMAVDRRQIHA